MLALTSLSLACQDDECVVRKSVKCESICAHIPYKHRKDHFLLPDHVQAQCPDSVRQANYDIKKYEEWQSCSAAWCNGMWLDDNGKVAGPGQGKYKAGNHTFGEMACRGVAITF